MQLKSLEKEKSVVEIKMIRIEQKYIYPKDL